MENKIVTGILAFFLVFTPSASFAQSGQGEQRGIHEPGTGIENPELKDTGQKTGQGLEAESATKLQNQGEERQNRVETRENNEAQDSVKGKGMSESNGRAVERRSRAANAVQEMLRLAERNKGMGSQIRTIAQNQNQNQEQIEAAMEKVKNRGKIRKFFFGPDYKNLDSIKEKLADHADKLEQLKELAGNLTDENDLQALKEQIDVMEQVKTELEEEAEKEGRGFSLFGFINKLFSKK